MTTKTTKTTTASAKKVDPMSMFEGPLKDSFEKSVTAFGDFTAFGKDNVEAMIEFTNATTKGLESLHSETVSYSKQAVEDGIESAKAAMTAKSVQELIEIQSNFTKSAVESYMGQMNKMTDMMSEVAREASSPLTGRWNAFVALVQSARA